MQNINARIDRRHFMRDLTKASAFSLVPSILTSFLSSCKREEIPYEASQEAVQKLANLPRRAGDVFTYFVHSDFSLVCNGQLKKCSRSFRSSKVVYKSNFNLFDGIYSGMELTKTIAIGNQSKYLYTHPIYTGLEFYIQRFDMKNSFILPKKAENLFLIHPVLIGKQLYKFNVQPDA